MVDCLIAVTWTFFSIGDVGGSDDFLSGTTGRTRTLLLGGQVAQGQ